MLASAARDGATFLQTSNVCEARDYGSRAFGYACLVSMPSGWQRAGP